MLIHKFLIFSAERLISGPELVRVKLHVIDIKYSGNFSFPVVDPNEFDETIFVEHVSRLIDPYLNN